MKKILYLLLVVQTVFFASCEKNLDTEGVSKKSIAIYLDGSNFLTIPKGTDYVDPGYKAIDGNTNADVTNKLQIDNPVDSNVPGYYEISYTITNNDGISSSAIRKVVVYDPNAPSTNISGKYLSKVQRISPARTYDKKNLTITKLAPGFFAVSDFLGGYYDQGAGYGSAYAASGYLQLNADNTFTLISSFVPGWGDSLDSLTGSYDPNTKLVTWTSDYAGMQFVVTLTFVE